MKPRSNIERFWSQTKRVGNCIERRTYKDKDGYTKFFVRLRSGKYHLRVAHRWIYEQVCGKLKPKQVVMHTCDRPACVKLQHLSAGTQRTNIADAITKRRHISARGHQHPKAKLTWKKVRAIRRSNETCTKLARRYRVSIALVSLVRLHKIWRENDAPRSASALRKNGR